MPSSTGSGLAASLVKANDWLKTRFSNIDIFDEHHSREAQTNPYYCLGSIFYLVWFLVMASGVLLIMWYVPTKAGAFDSIHHITESIPFGLLIRGIHKYGADAMIIAATMRLYRMFILADYKPGKELNIAIALVTLLLAMYSGLTGYLLIWNQRAFWATKVFATFPTYMDQFPFMGDFYQPLVKSLHLGWNTAEFLLGAGGAITQNTITRFFSIHLAFSLVPLIFVELYFYKTGFKRISLNWTKRVIILLMLVAISIFLPAAIGSRSNPDVTPLPILSDWYFLGLYQMYKYLEPVVATEITMLIPLTVILVPFIDVWITGPEKGIWKRPLVLVTSIMGLVTWVVFSFLIIFNIANIHNDPPYWRDFLWLMVDVGIVWQLVLIWKYADLKQRSKSVLASMVMAVIAGSQTVLAIWYYFMARTEMFLSPLLQAWTYWIFRPFMGNHAAHGEDLVRANQEGLSYWDYPIILAQGAAVAGRETLLKFKDLCAQATPLDWLFKAIPTFQKDPYAAWAYTSQVAPDREVDLVKAVGQPINFLDEHPDLVGILSLPDLKYQGMIDYLISNRWCFDYVTFVDRMTPGLVDKYPLPVPALDWPWMVAAPLVTAMCIWTAIWCRTTAGQAAKIPPAQPKAPASCKVRD